MDLPWGSRRLSKHALPSTTEGIHLRRDQTSRYARCEVPLSFCLIAENIYLPTSYGYVVDTAFMEF